MPQPTTLTPRDLARYAEPVLAILAEVDAVDPLDTDTLHRILRKHPRDGSAVFSKNQLVRTYRYLCDSGRLEFDADLLRKIQMKPVRTISGVTPVTILTKPFPCPGKCVFCPTDVRMPKSYLHDEPGAMRAEQHGFDPFEQTDSRIQAFRLNGHGVDKIELLVLGGTWSSYPRDYQEWFLKRSLDAMNGREARDLVQAQDWNETAPHRNVGMVLETRPDHVTPREVRWLRHLGATKIQMGAQSLDDAVLERNRRGHTVDQTRQAMRLLRAAGFKLVLHWMPNLWGATLASDREDFARLWSDPALRPDEIKIYSTALLENAELYEVWERGEYQPYEVDDLVELTIDCKRMVPRYCRINRVVRDIPSTNIVAGSKMTNMRQHIHQRMRERGQRCACIRCREVRGGSLAGELTLRDEAYETTDSREHFLSFVDEEDRLAGYCRLSLPATPGSAGDRDLGLPELAGAALIREVHVYGPALDLGASHDARAQHRGLGTRLIERAEQLAHEAGYDRLAIIASVGTRGYYARRGYAREGTYMTRGL